MWEHLIAAGVSSAASLAGIPWQHELQKDLMHENEAINLKQWQREADYNSLPQQMARARLAGLNPHIVVNGNVDNTAPHADLTSGTPQAPGAAAAVGSAVRNSFDAALLGSEINKNQAEANRANSQSGEADANTQWKNATLQPYLQQMAAQLGWTEKQTELAGFQCEFVQMQSYQLSKSIEEANARIGLLSQQTKTERQRTRLFTYDADMAVKMLRNYDKIIESSIQKTISEIGLNEASAANLSAYTYQLWGTMKSVFQIYENQGNFWYHNGLYQQALNQYQRKQNAALDEQLKFLPFYYGNLMYHSTKYAKRDKEGQIVLDPKTGWPVLNSSAQAFERVMEQGSMLLNNLESVSRSLYNIGGTIGQIKSSVSLPQPSVGFSANGLPQPAQMYTDHQRSSEREATKAESDMFSHWYDTMDGQDAFKRVQEYKKKHNIY